MTILVNKAGDVFLEFLDVREQDIAKYTNDAPLTHSLVIGKHKEAFLLLFNKWKKYWELPGGIN